ncbi:MAG: ribosome silencing factor [Bacteroidales bacterium]|nr:ribosome silencing factor [Bacteroidales bacterium]
MGGNTELIETIISGILEKKGKEIINITFKKNNNAVCDNFIICHGDSKTQVVAIADSVEEKVKVNLDKPIGHREGAENAQWILLDFYDIIVHIFQKETREYYRIEELWGDALITRINDNHN